MTKRVACSWKDFLFCHPEPTIIFLPVKDLKTENKKSGRRLIPENPVAGLPGKSGECLSLLLLLLPFPIIFYYLYKELFI